MLWRLSEVLEFKRRSGLAELLGRARPHGSGCPPNECGLVLLGPARNFMAPANLPAGEQTENLRFALRIGASIATCKAQSDE